MGGSEIDTTIEPTRGTLQLSRSFGVPRNSESRSKEYIMIWRVVVRLVREHTRNKSQLSGSFIVSRNGESRSKEYIVT